MPKLPQYFPVKRVLAMIATAIVNTASWVPTVQQIVAGCVIERFPNAPKDINWLAIISIIVFLGFVIWSLWDLSRRIESERPQLTIGDQTQITKIVENDVERKLQAVFNIAYKNIGQRPAYQLCLHIGFARQGFPNEFTLFSDRTSANRQDPNCGEIGESYTLTVQYEKGDQKPMGLSKVVRVLIYCGLSYSDASVKGHLYCDEWWFSYGFGDKQFTSMPVTTKDELEPYVRLAYSKRKN